MHVAKVRGNGAAAGMFAAISAWGVNWLITPASRPDASTALQAAVMAQVIIAAALAVWFWRRAGRAASGTAHPAPSA